MIPSNSTNKLIYQVFIMSFLPLSLLLSAILICVPCTYAADTTNTSSSSGMQKASKAKAKEQKKVSQAKTQQQKKLISNSEQQLAKAHKDKLSLLRAQLRKKDLSDAEKKNIRSQIVRENKNYRKIVSKYRSLCPENKSVSKKLNKKSKNLTSNSSTTKRPTASVPAKAAATNSAANSYSSKQSATKKQNPTTHKPASSNPSSTTEIAATQPTSDSTLSSCARYQILAQELDDDYDEVIDLSSDDIDIPPATIEGEEEE